MIKTASDFVGYGVQTQVKVPGKFLAPPPPGHRWVGAGERMFADGQLVSGNFAHSDEFARFSMNRGGFCFGDSGRPDLLAGTDTVIGVNSYVTNFNCSGVGYSSRVDTPEARSWIEGFMR